MGTNGEATHSKAGRTQNQAKGVLISTAIQSPKAKASAQILRINPSDPVKAVINADNSTCAMFSNGTGSLFETPARLQLKFSDTSTNNGYAW
jgi:hypothetical protein